LIGHEGLFRTNNLRLNITALEIICLTLNATFVQCSDEMCRFSKRNICILKKHLVWFRERQEQRAKKVPNKGEIEMDAFGCTFRLALHFAVLPFELQNRCNCKTHAAAGQLLQDL
jgi:hypothetical protein